MGKKQQSKGTRSAERTKVIFHRRGREVESAWCVPLVPPHRYRLENILFLHATPCWGDEIEARPSDAFDGQPTFRRVVKPGGRYPMIVDYPKVSDFKKLGTLLRRRFDVVGEGCYPPQGDEPGRVFLAVPDRHSPATVFAAASAGIAGLIAVHPELPAPTRRLRPGPKKRVSARKPAPKGGTQTRQTGADRLFEAITSNDVEAFARLKRSDLAFRDQDHRSLLFHAVLEGRTEIVKRLIDAGADVNPSKPRDTAPLIAAALRNRPRETKLLLAAGADPALARDRDGDPVLVTAAFRENIAVVRALITVAHPAEHISLALLEAAGIGNLPIVKLLVKHGADPDWKSKRGNTARSIARKRRRREVVAYFAKL